MHTPGYGLRAVASACATLLLACGHQAADAMNQVDASEKTGMTAQDQAGGGADDTPPDAPLAGTAIALIEPYGEGTVTGTATFIQTDSAVTLVVALNHCPDGAHSVHVNQGTSCADHAAQGGTWDTTRGEGIPDVVCSDDRGAVMTMRVPGDPMAWSIGGPAATSLVGHVVVVDDGDDPTLRVGCGQITVR